MKVKSKLSDTANNYLKHTKKQKGITLIALVITIIVLLILAGVSIATLTGPNGLLTRANDAKINTEKAEEDELRKLTQAEAATYIEKHEYTDVSGEKVTVPAKCAVSQVKGENTLEDGLVIIDVNGNEWVWIEVPKNIEVYPTSGLDITNFTDDEYEKIYNDLKNYTSTYSGGYIDEWYDGNGETANESKNLNDISGCGLTNAEYKKLKQKMLKSIYQEEGFYIGRYEVGIKEDVYRSYGTTYDVEHPIEETPVIQANKYVYNWIRTYQAQELCTRLTVGQQTSSLIFGIQWDLVLKFIETKNPIFGDMNKTIQQKLKENSSSWGTYSDIGFTITNINAKYSDDDGANYKSVSAKGYQKPSANILLTTGPTKRNSVLNIYDLAGNVRERNLSKITGSPGDPCSYRGGAYLSYGTDRPAADQYWGLTTYSDNTTGFRPVLYVK